MKRNILRILFTIAIITTVCFLANSTTAEERFLSNKGPASRITPEETDPNAIALLIQDVDPWYGGNNHTALHDMNIPHDVRM